MLFLDKYRPNNFRDFTLHKDIANTLKKLVSEKDFTHLLFYGPPGSGKKTLIISLLRELYAHRIKKVKLERKTWDLDVPGRDRKLEIDLTTLSSEFHIEMNPSDVGSNDRYVIQTIIAEMSKNISSENMLDCHIVETLKVLIITGADQLSKEAQQGLRRTMEKCSSVCRLIMCCNSQSKIMEQLRSRCLTIRVPATKQEDISIMLRAISAKEKTNLSRLFASRIANSSNRNLRRAIVLLEACVFLDYDSKKNITIPTLEWELQIHEIADIIIEEQTPKKIYSIRSKLYELLISCIPPELLLTKLLYSILRRSDEKSKHVATKAAAFFDQRLHGGSKAIFHLEAFVAELMYHHKRYLNKLIV